MGVALGSLLSHGIAIMFGSFLGNIDNLIFQYVEVADWTNCFQLSVSELQAINQQVKELGWDE